VQPQSLQQILLRRTHDEKSVPEMMALKDNATAPKTPAPPSPLNPNPNSLHADALCVLVAITTTLDRHTFALSPPPSSFASTRFAFGPEGETFSLVKSKLPEGRAMAGASRQMGRCFVSSAKSAFRFCGKSSGDAAASGAGRGGLGMPSMATGRSAPSCSAKSFMETRRPSSSFMFR